MDQVDLRLLELLQQNGRISQQDLANVHQRGGEVVVEDLDFTGFSSYSPAALAVARALKTLSYPLARGGGAVLASALKRAWWSLLWERRARPRTQPDACWLASASPRRPMAKATVTQIAPTGAARRAIDPRVSPSAAAPA